MAKKLEKKNKTIWSSMWAIMTVSLTAPVAGIFVAAFLIPEGVWQADGRDSRNLRSVPAPVPLCVKA